MNTRLSVIEDNNYSGYVSMTDTGQVCQAWSSNKPHEIKREYTGDKFPDGSIKTAKNYCRDPGNDGYLWCYTTNPGLRRDTCTVYLNGRLRGSSAAGISSVERGKNTDG